MFTIKIRIRGYQRGNQKWKLQRSFQHRVNKTQDEDKLKKSTTQYVLDTLHVWETIGNLILVYIQNTHILLIDVPYA
jgi:hypothetical protein